MLAQVSAMTYPLRFHQWMEARRRQSRAKLALDQGRPFARRNRMNE